MTFYVNAWLDRTNPFVSIHNKQTGELVLKLEKQALATCLEQGDLCLNELCDNAQQTQQALIKTLLLTHCAHSLGLVFGKKLPALGRIPALMSHHKSPQHCVEMPHILV